MAEKSCHNKILMSFFGVKKMKTREDRKNGQ